MIQAIVFLIPALLVILATVWALWLIFRKGDMVTKPGQVVTYFVGALVALVTAGCMMIFVLPAWMVGIWDYANGSPSVIDLQKRTETLLNQTVGGQQPARPPYATTPPVSPIASPGGNAGAQSVATLVPGQTIVHIVQKGDTVYSLAKRYGVTVESIQAANSLVNINDIQVNQRLIIPK